MCSRVETSLYLGKVWFWQLLLTVPLQSFPGICLLSQSVFFLKILMSVIITSFPERCLHSDFLSLIFFQPCGTLRGSNPPCGSLLPFLPEVHTAEKVRLRVQRSFITDLGIFKHLLKSYALTVPQNNYFISARVEGPRFCLQSSEGN